MTTFDDRERAFEAAFAHDEELRFRALAHRNREIGLWAARKLGKSGAEATAYAETIVAAGITKPGDDVIQQKLEADLRAGGVDIPPGEIATVLTRMLSEAIVAQDRH